MTTKGNPSWPASPTSRREIHPFMSISSSPKRKSRSPKLCPRWKRCARSPRLPSRWTSPSRSPKLCILIHRPSITSRNTWPFVSSTALLSSRKTKMSTITVLRLANYGKPSKIRAFQRRRFFIFCWDKKTNTESLKQDSRNTVSTRFTMLMTLKLCVKPAFTSNGRCWGR